MRKRKLNLRTDQGRIATIKLLRELGISCISTLLINIHRRTIKIIINVEEPAVFENDFGFV